VFPVGNIIIVPDRSSAAHLAEDVSATLLHQIAKDFNFLFNIRITVEQAAPAAHAGPQCPILFLVGKNKEPSTWLERSATVASASACFNAHLRPNPTAKGFFNRELHRVTVAPTVLIKRMSDWARL
jgi:hypothetical protein